MANVNSVQRYRERRPQRGARALDVNGERWWYRVGEGFIRIWKPTGASVRVELPEVRGLSHDLIERGRWKCTGDGMVRPAHVWRYIEQLTRSTE